MNFHNTKKLALITFILAVYAILSVRIWQNFLADIYFKSSQNEYEQSNLQRAVQYANMAISYNKSEPAYYRGRAKYLIAYTLYTNKSQKEVVKKTAYSDLQKAFELNKKNLATIRNSIPLYYFLAVDDLAGTGNESNLDKEYKNAAKLYMKRNKHIAPYDVGMYVLMAKYEKKLFMDKELNESLRKIKELRPDLMEWHPDLVQNK